MLVSQDWRNLRGDRGNSGFDRRHRLVAHALMELPFGRDHPWLREPGFVATLLRDWQISAVGSMQSGAPFDVTIVDSANRLGVTPNSSVWRPDLAGEPIMPNPTADAWLDPSAFAIPQNADESYRYGTMGRNTLRGPGYFTLDAGLTRNVRLGSRRTLQVRWEVFNLTNHPSYDVAERQSRECGLRNDPVHRERPAPDAVRLEAALLNWCPLWCLGCPELGLAR